MIIVDLPGSVRFQSLPGTPVTISEVSRPLR
jgi:hypothetical protein